MKGSRTQQGSRSAAENICHHDAARRIHGAAPSIVFLVTILSAAGTIVSALQSQSFIQSHYQSGLTRIRSTATPDQSKDKIEEESNFWFSVRRKALSDKTPVPSFESLDLDGPLPSPCYHRLGNAAFEPKPSCLVSIDLEQENENEDILRFMQVCIDFGLTNFQGGKAKIYRELCKNTPPSVMNRCNLITSIPLPRELPPGAARSILLHPLSEMGVSCIDTLRIDWKPSSPYFLDLLDVATDLQREGIIRSIAGKRIPNSALRRAHSCGFRVETNQIPANILDPCAFYNSDSLLMVHDTHTKLIIENPAAGGLLSSRYFNRPGEPYKFEMTTTERKNLRSLYKWQGRQESGMKSSWRLFQSKVMDTLHDISLKHQVPLDVVVHRWALQLEGVAGTVASCEFRDGNDLGAQPKKLRKVFQLNLDEEDCAQLWKASGCERPTSDIPAIDLHEVEQGDNGPFFPPGAKLLWI